MASSAFAPLSRLRMCALVILVLVVLQAALGIGSLMGHEWGGIHGMLGYINFVVAIIAAVFAFQASKADARFKGLLMHAVSLPVLAVIQIGIIEAAGDGPLKWVHVVLGFAYLVAAGALWALAGKRADQAAHADVVR